MFFYYIFPRFRVFHPKKNRVFLTVNCCAPLDHRIHNISKLGCKSFLSFSISFLKFLPPTSGEKYYHRDFYPLTVSLFNIFVLSCVIWINQFSVFNRFNATTFFVYVFWYFVTNLSFVTVVADFFLKFFISLIKICFNFSNPRLG